MHSKWNIKAFVYQFFFLVKTSFIVCFRFNLHQNHIKKHRFRGTRNSLQGNVFDPYRSLGIHSLNNSINVVMVYIRVVINFSIRFRKRSVFHFFPRDNQFFSFFAPFRFQFFFSTWPLEATALIVFVAAWLQRKANPNFSSSAVFQLCEQISVPRSHKLVETSEDFLYNSFSGLLIFRDDERYLI